MRNFGSSLGLAVLGSIFISENVRRIDATLVEQGVPAAKADAIAHAVTSSGGSSEHFGNQAGAAARSIFEAVQLDVAHSTRTVVTIMAAVMFAALLVSIFWMTPGRVEIAEHDGNS